MKIRIRTAAVEPGAPFEHPGPVVRLGRDPACELVLEGQAAETVSRWHARIDLGPDGATLTDTGSSNGTFLNDRRVEPTAPLRVGDRIRLGQMGVQLTVVDMDLAAAAVPFWRRPAAWAAAAAAPLALGLAWLVFHPGPPPDTSTKEGLPSKETPGDETPKDPLRGAGATGQGTQRPKASTHPAPPSSPPDVLDGGNVVGRYEVPKGWVNVLLQRRGEAYPWRVLASGDEVRAGHTLVSLPGYQGILVLDCGVNVTLWGHLPDQGGGAPVLESVVLLHQPTPGCDVDLTLDRGRIRLTNVKPDGQPARVRVRFQRQSWQLSLGKDCQAVLELYGQPYWSARGPHPRAFLDLTAAEGTVGVEPSGVSDPVEPLARPDRLRWQETADGKSLLAPLPGKPEWWPQAQAAGAPANPGQDKVRRSLLDWSDRLGGTTITQAQRPDKGKDRRADDGTDKSVVSLVKTGVMEVDDRDPDNQDLGVLFLAALDELPPLLDVMQDRQHTNVRGAAYYALQVWLGRGPAHAARLEGLLAKKEADPAVAKTVVRLLHNYPQEALADRRTYVDLVQLLGHEKLLLRDLAFWQMGALWAGGWLPQEAAKIPYRPDDPDVGRRMAAVQAWKKLLADGKLPARPGG